MLGYHKQQIAINLLINLLIGLILHIIWILIVHAIDNNLFRKLNSQSIFVNSYFLNIVSAPNLYSGFGN